MNKLLSAFYFNILKKLTVFALVITSLLLGGRYLINLKNAKADTLLDFQSKSTCLIDYDSKTILLSKNENQKLPIASMCKIMTLNLIFDEIEKGNISLEEEINASENASSMGGSQAYLDANCNYKVSDLICSIIIASANDSCIAFAEKIAGSEDAFVTLMNEKAKSLGCNNTNYVNATGLPKDGQYSTASDVALCLRELLTHQDYYKFSKIWTYDFVHPSGRITTLTNTNKLSRFYEGCDGGKTGYTAEAGHCLSATAKRGDMRLISVVISSPDSKTRFKESSDMLSYGFANYTTKTIVKKGEELSLKVKVKNGKKDYVKVSAKEDFVLLTKKNEKPNLTINFKPLESVKAPIKKGDTVGVLSIYKDNVLVKEVEVVSNENINKATIFDIILDIGKEWAI